MTPMQATRIKTDKENIKEKISENLRLKIRVIRVPKKMERVQKKGLKYNLYKS